MSKSKPCFEILGKKAFRWHLETWKNQIGSIFKLNIKKSVKFQKKILPCPSLPPPSTTTPWGGFFDIQGVVVEGGGREGQGRIFFLEFDTFFDIQFKNTSNLISPSFKVPSKNFFPRISKQGLLFDICDFSIFKIQSEIVNISIGHPVHIYTV